MIKSRNFKGNRQEIIIETFDGSGSLTHPSIQYFPNKFNGYIFWMVYTPYNNCDIELENPCICVSNDGINFKNIGKTPLLPIIHSNQIEKKYYNDPFLFFNDNHLEIWYRYTEENKETIFNYVYRIISYDGVNWQEPELMLDDNLSYMSLSIIKENNKYKIFYFDYENKLCYRESENLKIWKKPKIIDLNISEYPMWHAEIRFINNSYEYLFIDKKYNLYYSIFDKNFKIKLIKKLDYTYDINEYYSNSLKYKSTFIHFENKIYLYIPFRYDRILLFKFKNFIRRKWRLVLYILDENNIN
ncbi:MAG: hypothetical protein IJ501_01915 [Bacilli bacterium]|nr:hypothetical protein [Bacilli bacterium]